MPALRLAACAAAALAALGLAAWPAQALTCAAQVVSARGDPSRFEVLAKAKARGNWRAKVRALPALGAVYADFSKAADADYSCKQEAEALVCTASGRPCRE